MEGEGPRTRAQGAVEAQRAGAGAVFSEREFYRREFRGRTLAVALPGEEDDARGRALEPVLAELRDAGARAVLIAESPRALAELVPDDPLSSGTEPLLGSVGRRLREAAVVGIDASAAADFAVACQTLALRLGLFKIVWLDPAGGLRAAGDERLSFVHQAELHQLLAGEGAGLASRERVPLWLGIERMLEAGVPAVNVCSAEGLDAELFTYAGSGTLFTRERYMDVRALGVDDYDAACDLVSRGVSEGYLAPRSEDSVEAVLASGFGAFVEGSHLAGLGALLPGGDGRSGEIASLYTLTRFLGEGVGVSLVGFAVERARALGYAYVYACTTSNRVGAFFERNGFTAVSPDAIPVEKWHGYDPARRSRVRCFRRDMA